MQKMIFALTVCLTTVALPAAARASCGETSCKVKLLDASCTAWSGAWPADDLLVLGVDCERYCPYVDPSTNENVPYWAEQDGDQSAAVLSLREQGAAAGTKVAGTFGALGKTCGDFHLVQFDSTLNELTSYTVMVGYSDSATLSTGASVGGCSLTRGPASLAGGLPVLLALLGLAILRQPRRR